MPGEVAVAIQPRTERSFERSSPVARYWLAQCEGFRVAGEVKGTVEQVVGTSDAQQPEVLVVRRALRRRNVPISDVETVVPAARLITIGGECIAATPAPSRGRVLANARSQAMPVAASFAARTSVLAVSLAATAAVVARRVTDVAFTVLMVVAAALFALAAFLGRLAIYGAERLTVAEKHLAAEIRARREANRSQPRASRRR
jgi:hypothetical protein